MTILSKLVSPRPARGSVLQSWARLFRWDAKPDNIQAHSFPHGLRAPPHWSYVLLSGLFIGACFNWSALKKLGVKIPNIWLQDTMDFFSEEPRTQGSEIPSSLAADVYDKYGEEGVDAMVKAWESQKDKSAQPEWNAIHAVMMAEAATRYKDEVSKEAEVMGLDKDEKTVEMIQKKTAGISDMIGKKFSASAEEQEPVLSVLEETMEYSGSEIKMEKQIGFRDRKIIEYENRIRQYSAPDKVFRYFATYKIIDDKGNNEVMMTPRDFLRSISPGVKQPENLGLDQFISVPLHDVDSISTKLLIDQESIFYELGSGGLISFSDYIFLLTVLSTSRRHFQIAFKMFDLNGDGNVDADEFEKVTDLMKQQSSTGARHRDHGSNNSFKGVNSGLKTFFFGEDLKGNLTVDRFLQFQKILQEEILALEFRRNDADGSGKISEKDFADLLIAYGGFLPKKRAKMLKRVKKTFDDENSLGIHLNDYLNFYQVLYSINEIDTALQFYTIAGAPIERSTMKHVAKTVAHVELSDHLVDVVFTLFDNDGDGKLSNKEFVSVMKQRVMRGLEKPKDTGVSRILSSIIKCANDCKPAIMGGVKKTE